MFWNLFKKLEVKLDIDAIVKEKVDERLRELGLLSKKNDLKLSSNKDESDFSGYLFSIGSKWSRKDWCVPGDPFHIPPPLLKRQLVIIDEVKNGWIKHTTHGEVKDNIDKIGQINSLLKDNATKIKDFLEWYEPLDLEQAKVYLQLE